jgi:inner membrane protein
VLVVLFWGLRWFEHGRAVQLATSQSLAAPPLVDEPSTSSTEASSGSTAPEEPNPTPVYLSAQRALASPDPFSIFRWYTVTDFGPLYQLERVDTREQTLVATEGTYAKPDRSPPVLAAEESFLGRAYLDWSSMPILTIDNSAAAIEEAVAGQDIEPPPGGTVVTFRDPRFMGLLAELPWIGSRRLTPLMGTVVLDQNMRVVLETMDGGAQRLR